jgi:tRNA modification GTPase
MRTARYRRAMVKGYLDVEDDIAALATPSGTGALAVIRLSGPGSIDRFAEVFSRPDVLRATAGYSAAFGNVHGTERRVIDEVVALVFRAPASYTGQDGIDIMCHGGQATVAGVLSALDSAGFRRALPGEFTFRAFYNGKMDLARAEAVNELVLARTSEARADAYSRLSGGLSRELAAMRKDLIRIASACALRLDYGEDETPEDLSVELPAIKAARDSCLRLADSYTVGRVLRDGAVVALSGRTNAGKSSLFNRLLKEERAIVSSSHGTTRDFLEAELDLGGLPVRLVDTAGVRDSDDPVEAEGVRRALLVAVAADLVVHVVDATAGISAADAEFVRDHPGAVLAWNKIDETSAAPVPPGWIGVSAVTGAGEAELVAAIRMALVGAGSGGLASGRGSVPAGIRIGTERHRAALVRAASSLGDAEESIANGEPVDMIAVDVATAIEAIGEISGETTSEDILESLFCNFCVGK